MCRINATIFCDTGSGGGVNGLGGVCVELMLQFFVVVYIHTMIASS